MSDDSGGCGYDSDDADVGGGVSSTRAASVVAGIPYPWLCLSSGRPRARGNGAERGVNTSSPGWVSLVLALRR